ncbi:kinase [Lactobacillus bombicola]|nr:kinase [Lactobacillus bombicola]
MQNKVTSLKQTMLLLAGSPGTGKSYLGNIICKEIPDFFNKISIDFFKEKLYEENGFDNIKEKTNLDNLAYTLFYQSIEKSMQKGQSIIADYPFSYRQYDTLKILADKYKFQIITITLICDLDILYQRQKERDLDPERPLGFIMNHYHKGDTLSDRTKMDIQKTKAEFTKFNDQRGYAKFKLGKTLVFDVSDFTHANYPALINKIKKWVGYS